MDYQDYYATLGVSRSASQADIKKAFRKLARQHHPDRNQGDAAAEQRFKAVNEANEVLSDPEKRELYDRLGKDWEAYARSGAASRRRGRWPSPIRSPRAGRSRRTPRVRRPAGSATSSGPATRRTSATSSTSSSAARLRPTGAAGRQSGRARSGTGGPTFDDILAGIGIDAEGGSTRRGHGRSRTAPTSSEAEAEVTLEEAFGGHETARRGRRPPPRGHDPAGV